MSSNYTQLRSNARLDLVSAVPLPGPISVYLEVTNICNFKCVFCPESFDNYEAQAGGLFRSSDDDILAILDQLASLGTVKTLSFYMMGEPFVHKSLMDFVRHAKLKKAAQRLIVTSNGSLLLPKVFSSVVASGLDYLRISIYGGTEEKHRERTQNNTPLARIRENVAAFRQFRDQAGASTPFIYAKMIESQDEEENNAFRKLFEGVADEVNVEPVMNWNDPREGNLAGIPQQEMLATPYFAKRKHACPFPFYTMVIHSDLRVSVCCVDWSKQLIIGDLRKESISTVWSGEKLRNIQLTHLEGRRSELPGCASCSYLHTAPDNIDALSPIEFERRCQSSSGPQG